MQRYFMGTNIAPLTSQILPFPQSVIGQALDKKNLDELELIRIFNFRGASKSRLDIILPKCSDISLIIIIFIYSNITVT